MHIFTTGGKTVSVFPSTKPGAPAIYLNTYFDEGQEVFQIAQNENYPPFTLVAVSNLNWNCDMVPWDSSATFKNGKPFTGRADEYLRLLVEKIIPEAEEGLNGSPRWRGIAGYSLAGLFAIYAIYRTGIFSRAASMSGSLWFPGFKVYIFFHEPKYRPDCMYFFLGDRESKTRSPVLKTVHQNTAEVQAFYQGKGIDTVFQLNPGNHFVHGVERIAASIICFIIWPIDVHLFLLLSNT